MTAGRDIAAIRNVAMGPPQCENISRAHCVAIKNDNNRRNEHRAAIVYRVSR